MIPYKLVKKGCIYGNADTDSFLLSVTYDRKFYCLSESTDKYTKCLIQKAEKTGSSNPKRKSLEKVLACLACSPAKFRVTNLDFFFSQV